MSSDFYPSQLSTRPHDAKKFENAKNIVHLGLFYENLGHVRLGSIRNKNIGIMRVSVCLGAILIPEYLDFHSGYSTLRSRIAGIYSGLHSGINSYSGISQTNAL